MKSGIHDRFLPVQVYIFVTGGSRGGDSPPK